MINQFEINTNNNEGYIFVDSKNFTNEAIIITSNIFLKNYYISFFSENNNITKITIKQKDKSNITKDILQKFMNYLMEYQLKINLQKEFGDLRKKIIEYTFAPIEK